MQDERLFLMAGLWAEAHDPATDEVADTYTVIITDANAAMRVHDRMPVILGTDAARRWSEPGPLSADILVPYPADEITTWRVGDAAKNSRNEPHRGWRNRSRRPVDVPVRPPPRTLVPFPQYHILSGPYPFPVEGCACNE